MVAHRTTERKVLGSIPSGSWAFFLYSIRIVCPYSGRSWRYITTDFPSWQKTKGQNPNYFAPISLYAAVPIFIKGGEPIGCRFDLTKSMYQPKIVLQSLALNPDFSNVGENAPVITLEGHWVTTSVLKMFLKKVYFMTNEPLFRDTRRKFLDYCTFS